MEGFTARTVRRSNEPMETKNGTATVNSTVRAGRQLKTRMATRNGSEMAIFTATMDQPSFYPTEPRSGIATVSFTGIMAPQLKGRTGTKRGTAKAYFIATLSRSAKAC